MNKKIGTLPNIDVKKLNNIVCSLVNLYKTCSPFKICKKMGINVLVIELPEAVDGFFVKSDDINNKNYISILINTSVAKKERKKICAHELGHAILHQNVNAENCADSTFLENLELEAEIFSSILLNKNFNKSHHKQLFYNSS